MSVGLAALQTRLELTALNASDVERRSSSHPMLPVFGVPTVNCDDHDLVKFGSVFLAGQKCFRCESRERVNEQFPALCGTPGHGRESWEPKPFEVM